HRFARIVVHEEAQEARDLDRNAQLTGFVVRPPDERHPRAAFEGLYETPDGGAGMALIGWPDDEAGELRGAVEVPGLLSFLVHDDPSEPVLGLDAFRPEDRPKALIPFFSYRVMVGCGTFFIALTLFACWRWFRGSLFSSRWLMRVFLFAVIPAALANQAGWVAAETARQPWIVHPTLTLDESGEPARDADGFIAYATVTTPDGDERIAGLRTTDGVSRAIESEQVLRSVVLFGMLYLLLGSLWAFLLYQKVLHGPEDETDESPPEQAAVTVEVLRGAGA
ncbi:MAG: cytochrome ubiquinol oxidase subunit I, partial [Planctomycetota bacterium]